MFDKMIQHAYLRTVVLWSVIISLAALSPTIYGYFHQMPGSLYSGLNDSIYPVDVNSYFAWIKQAYDGKLLFEDKFTTEMHHAWIFLPVFLFIGHTARLLHVDVMYVWYTVMLISNFLMLFALYSFIKYFLITQSSGGSRSDIAQTISEMEDRRFNLDPRIALITAFILATVASGFGWFVGEFSADWWMPEMYLFQSMRWPFTFSLGTAMMLGVFLCLFRFIESGSMKCMVYAGSIVLMLSVVHPYDIFSIAPIGLSYVFFMAFRDKKIKQAVLGSTVFLAIAIPGVLYNYLIIVSDPVLKMQSEIAMASPSPLSYILGFGILFPLGIWGAVIVVKKANRHYYFLLSWFLIGFGLLYAPFSFQRRLAMGLNIPLVILSTVAIGEIVRNLKRQWALVIIVAVIIFASAGNIMFLLNDAAVIESGSFPCYISEDFRTALQWLDDNAKKTDVVLASYDSGNFIPRYSGTRTFIGHWAQTNNAFRKSWETRIFYSTNTPESDMIHFLATNHIKYILCTPREWSCSRDEWKSKVVAAGAQAVFANRSAVIYRVTLQ